MAQRYIAGGYGLPSMRKAEILANANRLPDYYSAKSDKAYNDKMLSLRENESRFNISNANKELALQKKIADQTNKEAKIGNAVGVAKLGLDAYSSLKDEGSSPVSNFLFSDRDKTGGGGRVAGQFSTQYGDGASADAVSEKLISGVGTGLGAVGGGLLGARYAKKLAEELPGGEKEWQVAAPLLGFAAGGYVGDMAVRAATPVVSSVWNWASSLFA